MSPNRHWDGKDCRSFCAPVTRAEGQNHPLCFVYCLSACMFATPLTSGADCQPRHLAPCSSAYIACILQALGSGHTHAGLHSSPTTTSSAVSCQCRAQITLMWAWCVRRQRCSWSAPNALLRPGTCTSGPWTSAQCVALLTAVFFGGMPAAQENRRNRRVRGHHVHCRHAWLHAAHHQAHGALWPWPRQSHVHGVDCAHLRCRVVVHALHLQQPAKLLHPDAAPSCLSWGGFH